MPKPVCHPSAMGFACLVDRQDVSRAEGDRAPGVVRRGGPQRDRAALSAARSSGDATGKNAADEPPQAGRGATFLVTSRISEPIAQLTSGRMTIPSKRWAPTWSQVLPSPPPLYSGTV